MGRKRKNNFVDWMSADQTRKYYNDRFAAMAGSQFEWHGFGNYFSTSYAEQCLYYTGCVVVWYDAIVKSFLCGKLLPGAEMDIYGRYTKYSVQTINGMHIELDYTNSVVIYDSVSRSGAILGTWISTPPAELIAHVVDEMTLLHHSKMININSLGCPLIISGTQSQQLTLKNAVSMYDSRSPYIFVDVDQTKQALDGEIKALRTDAPNNLASFSSELDKCWTEGLAILGIDNVAQQKAERLLVDEVNKNDEQTQLISKGKLAARQDGCGRINKMFKKRCYVRLRKGVVSSDDRISFSDSSPAITKVEPDPIPVSNGGDNTNG